MSKLILCPNCKSNEKPKILGSIDDDGNYFVIMSHNRSIKVTGSDFGIFCGLCSELVYFHKTMEEQPIIAIKVSRVQFPLLGTI